MDSGSTCQWSRARRTARARAGGRALTPGAAVLDGGCGPEAGAAATATGTVQSRDHNVLRHLDAVGIEVLPTFPDQLVAWSQSKRAQALLLEGRSAEAREALAHALPAATRSGDHPIVADVAVSKPRIT